jgi:NAD+ synthase (glutamine-hydrolysing)
MGFLRIAQAQINTTVGDLDGNSAKIASFIGRAKEQKADIVTFPELAVSGYPPEDLVLKTHFVRDCTNAVRRIARDVTGITALVGFPDYDGKAVYNAAALICDGEVVSVYHKIELPNYGVFDEKRNFTAGTEPLIFVIEGVRVLITVCEDIWIEGNTLEQCGKRHGAAVTLNISGSPYHAGKLSIQKEIAAGFARRTGSYLCYNNLVGGQDELVFNGTSLVVDPRGNLVARAALFTEDLLVTDIDIDSPGKKSAPAAAEPGCGSFPVVHGYAGGAREKAAPSVFPLPDRVEEIYRALVLGTGDYVRKNRFKKVVMGLSGGIDSSLVAAVAVDALGAENVVGVTMPSVYTSSETFSDAGRLAENLGIRLITTPIKEIFSTYIDRLSEVFGDSAEGVWAENLQARIRGNILMALSNKYGWMVLTTGNKSETAVGYSTLYGDTAGGFAVIKDVPKTVVYELSAHINEAAGREIIPNSVIVRPPTAELRPNQKDEDSLPPYSVLDPILAGYVEEDMSPEDIIALGFDEKRVYDTMRLVDINEYKRRQSPPGIKITHKAFGRDRRLPITNRYFEYTSTKNSKKKE